MQERLSRFKTIDGNALKVIACITMLIDHIGGAIIYPVVQNSLYGDVSNYGRIKFIYDIMRTIGRTSFPLFCFLLTEGFIHTKNRPRYALSLFLFAIISEIPYELAFHSDLETFNINIFKVLRANESTRLEHSNVFFTLFIGLMTIWAIDYFLGIAKKDITWYPRSLALSALSLAAGAYLAYYIKADYKAFGILLIAALSVFKPYEPLDIASGYIIFSMYGNEYRSLPAFILMYFYSKKRGRSLGRKKYLFYAFYPFHLILIWLIRCLMYGN